MRIPIRILLRGEGLLIRGLGQHSEESEELKGKKYFARVGY